MLFDSKKVRHLMLDSGIDSVKALADLTGVKYGTLFAVFNRGTCSEKTAMIISNAFGVDPSEIAKPLQQNDLALFRIDAIKIKHLMIDAGIIHSELARRIFVARQTLSIIFKRGSTTEANARRIARVLHVDVSEIMQEVGNDV